MLARLPETACIDDRLALWSRRLKTYFDRDREYRDRSRSRACRRVARFLASSTIVGLIAKAEASIFGF
jgi:hypothetical protein